MLSFKEMIYNVVLTMCQAFHGPSDIDSPRFTTKGEKIKEAYFLLPGTLTVEEVYKDRDQFAGLVREVAAPDVGRMGIEILSFTIKDVYDDVQYLASLGKAQTAAVKRDADIGVAQANRDAGIQVSDYIAIASENLKRVKTLLAPKSCSMEISSGVLPAVNVERSFG